MNPFLEKILTKKNIVGLCVILLVVVMFAIFFFDLQAVSADQNAPSQVFQITQGDGFRRIAQNLYANHLIRSPLAFEGFALLEGHASDLRPGLYRLDPTMDTPQIISAVSGGNAGEATVTIPEGSNIYDIDRILSNALVIKPGALINFTADGNLEGKLFPDTYNLYTNANVGDVVGELMDTFDTKALPLLSADKANENNDLIIASMLEKEVPDQADQELVAGIMLKRISLGIPLDIDATVCYAKLMANPALATQACSLSPIDFKIDSPYNTYMFKGLPPAPIGNPGISAITAALHPASSSYLYYLSDPKTGKTIFAKTLDEQNQNRIKYLDSN
jgi:UPF0755 protein